MTAYIEGRQGLPLEEAKANLCCATPGRVIKENEAAVSVDSRAACSGIAAEFHEAAVSDGERRAGCSGIAAEL